MVTEEQYLKVYSCLSSGQWIWICSYTASEEDTSYAEQIQMFTYRRCNGKVYNADTIMFIGCDSVCKKYRNVRTSIKINFVVAIYPYFYILSKQGCYYIHIA